MSRFEIEALRQDADPGPVTMLNLVKFRDKAADGKGSGRKAYSRYVKAAEKLVRGRGGAILWAGIIDGVALSDETDTDWDWGLLVYYPSREAFLEMVTSEEYAEANRHRENGVEKHIILASSTVRLEPIPSPS